VTEPSSTSNA